MPRYLSLPLAKNRKNDEIVYYSGLPVLFQFVRYHVGATGTGEHEIAGSVAAAGAGANRGEDLHSALYAGAELELHGADERPAGGHAHHGDHRYSTDADTGGGADLPDVAADAGRDGGVPGGLGGYQLAG